MAKDALGHGSYSGKYPNKIRDVGSIGQRGVVRATTNAGEHYDIHARDTGGLMPKPGEDIGKHPYAARVGGPSNPQAASELASGAKSAPIPTHDSMGTPRLADNIQNAAKGFGYHYSSLKGSDGGVGPNSPLAGSRDYDAFGRPRADKSSYDEATRDMQLRGRNGQIGSGMKFRG